MAEEKKILIPGRLKNASVGGHVAGTEDIYDDNTQSTQQEINAQHEAALNAPSTGVIARLETLEGEVAFSGDFEAENDPAGIVSGGEKITTANAVNGVLDYAGYFECSSNADAVTKAVLNTGYALRNGGCIKIKMTNANTANNVKLKLGNADAKDLYYNDEIVSNGNSWEAGEVVEVYYNGTAFYANNVAGGSGDGAFDISKYKAVNNTLATYRTLAEALGTNGANVPQNKRKGGMTIKYIQLTDATYSLVKTEGLETQPTGTKLQEAISIADGTYTGAQLPQNITLPQNIGTSTTYYLAVTQTVDEQEVTTYTMWVVTKLTNDITEYVQWVLKNTTWSIVQSDWIGKDETPTAGSTNWVTSGGVYDAVSRKADKDDVFITYDWDLSENGDFTYVLGTIHDDGNAYSSSSFYHVNIPVEEGLKIMIKANNSESARYAFLKDINFTYPSGGTDITEHYADNHIGINIITSGGEESFTIPEGCNYLYVEIGQKTGTVRTPAKVAYYEPQWDVLFLELSSEMLAEEDIDLTIYGRRNAYPVTVWNNSMYSVFVPVSTGEKYAIKPNSNFALTISFLSSSSYTIGQAVTTVIEKHTIAAGVESVLPVPSGALYMLIAITRKSDSANYTPEYVKKILPIGDYSAENRAMINDIEENATQWVECEYSSAISGSINLEGKWASVTSSAVKSGEVAVTAGKLYRITAQSTQPAVLRWLTASDTSHSNGDAAPVVESRGQIFLQAGSSMTLKAPSGAAVLNYIKTFNSNNRQPVIEKQGSGSGGDDGDEVSEKIIVPKIGCGTAIVSRLEDTYAHAPIILESTKYRYVLYQGSENVTIEDGHGTTYSHVLSVLNKYTGKTQFIKVFDCNNPDVINGNTCSIYYNESAAFVGEDILLVRTGCHLDGKWVEVYKTYNAVTNTLSSAALQQLSYNGSTYDFNLNNYLTMCNALYGTSLNVVDVRYTNQITNITKYGNYYYCVYALLPDSDVELPYVFARSSDAITWEPIANVYTGHSAETQLAIVNDVAYFAFRSMNLGTFFMAFNISDGSVVKAAYKMSSMASKPSIVYSAKHGKVIVGYNKVVGNASNRIGLTVAEVAADYTLTTLKNYINSNGWNYFYFCEKPNGNILSVSVEDFRQLNGGVLNAQTTTDVRIEEIDMFELLNQ